jgi:hypothetical protein
MLVGLGDEFAQQLVHNHPRTASRPHPENVLLDARRSSGNPAKLPEML